MSDLALSPGAAVITVQGYPPLVVQSVAGQSVDDLTASLSTLFPNQQVPLTLNDRMSNEYYRFFSVALQAQQGRVQATPTAALLVAINFAQNGVAQLQGIVEESRSRDANNAAVITALTAQVQALTTMAGAPPAVVPPVQVPPPKYIYDSPGGSGGGGGD